MLITHIVLLLIHVAYLEPYIGMCQRVWGVSQYAIETIERLLVFTLLLIDDTETKEDLVRLIEI